jgi:PBP1b-binding outer membrane lipoprotein LpoB
MKAKITVTAAILVAFFALSGCKKEDEVASPNCVNPATKNDPSLCPRADTGITRSKPKTWSMGSENK